MARPISRVYARRRVLGDLLKRFFNGAVLLLAVLTFFLVPLGRGKKTGAQHVSAIFATEPAHEAAEAVSEAAKQLAAVVSAELVKLQRAAEGQTHRHSAHERR